MYEEVQTLDMRNSSGSFALTMADGSGSRTDTTGLGLDRIFANRGSFAFSAATCTSGSSYTPSDGDGRNLVVLFKDETMASWEPIPAQKINYVPYAFSSQMVQGFGADSLLRVVDAGGDPLTGLAPLSNAQYTALLDLLNGSSAAYTKAGQLNGVALPTMTSGEVLGWNGTTWVSQAATSGPNSITTTMIQNGAVDGAKLDPAISISTSGTIASAITTTRDFKIYNATNQYVEMVANNSITGTTDVDGHVFYKLTWPAGAASTNGQVLTSDTSGNLSWSALPTALPPTGTAGGDLTGTYPNPTIAASAVTYAKIQDVTTGKLLGRSTAGPGSAEELSIGSGLSLSGGTLSSTNVSSQWTTHGADISYDGAGNVGIGTTAPLTKLEVAGSLRVGDGSETCDASITGAIRYNGGNLQFCAGVMPWTTLGVAGSGISSLTGDVTATGPGSVAATVASVGGSTAAQVHQSQLDTAAATSVNTPSTIVKRDASGNFSATDITASSVQADTLKLNNAGSILNIVNPIAGAWTLTLPTGAGATGQILTTNGSGVTSWSSLPTALPPTGSAGGDLTGTYPNPTIAANAVVTSKINDAAVTTPKINDAAVTTLKLGDKSVTYAKIQDVTTGKLLGRSTAGPGSAEELSIGSGLSLSGGTLSSTNISSQWTTHGSDISYDGAGNVGIGTAAPLAKLDINGGGLHIQNGSAYGALLGDTSAGDFYLSTGGAPRIYVKSSGRVGIGTAAPPGFFAVAPTQYSTGSALQSGTTITGTGTSWTSALVGSEFVFSNGTSAGTILSVAGANSLTVSTSQSSAGPYKILYAGLQVDGSGNVGIGTTAPGALFQVGNPATSLGTMRLAGNTSGYVQLQPSAAAGSWTMTLPPNAGASGYVLQTNGSGVTSWVAQSTGGTVAGADTEVQFNNAGSFGSSPKMTFAATTGRLTLNPVATSYTSIDQYGVHAIETSSGGWFRADRGSTNPTIGQKIGSFEFYNMFGSSSMTGIATENFDGLGKAGSAIAFTTTLNGGGSTTLERMRIDHNGNVGIGTTAPGYKLDVAGDINVTGSFMVNGVALATGGGDFKKDGSVAMTGTLKATTGTAAAPSFTFASDADTGLYSSAAGRVSFASDGAKAFEVIGTSDAYISNGILRAASGSIASPGIGFENNNKSGLYSPAGFTLGLVANNIEAMRIDSSGRIGIGTSAPTAHLTLAAGSASAGTAPLKFTSGPLMTTPEDGAMEYNSTSGLWFTIGSTRYLIPVNTAPGNFSNVTNISNASGSIVMSPIAGSGSVQINSGTSSLNSTSGALIVTGGAGISQNLNIGGNVTSGGSITSVSAYMPQIYGGTAPSADIKIDGTDNATKGNVLLATAGGNVGIGTTSPQAPLHIVNTASGNGVQINVVSGGVQPLLRLANTLAADGVGSFITFDGASSVPQSRITSDWTSYASGEAALSFAVRSSGATNERMRITGTGNVGIGTTSPSGNLEVSGKTSSLVVISNTEPNTGYDVGLAIKSYRNSMGQTHGPVIQSFAANGTASSPGPISSGMTLMSLRGNGYAQAGFGADRTGAEIAFVAESNWGNSVIPTYMTFATAPTLSWSPLERMRITSAGNVGIGTTAPAAKLEVAGTFKVGSGGELCPSVGAGGIRYNGGAIEFCNGASWAAVGGATNIDGLSDAKADSSSVFLGTSSGNADNGANANTAIGISALNANVSGSGNVAVGSEALYGGTGSTANTALGYRALYNSNSAYNVALGYNTGMGGVTGSGNTLVGPQAATSLTSGFSNVIVGSTAGNNLTTGTSNVVIGAGSGSTPALDSSNILIGFNTQVATANQSYYLNIGNTIYGNTFTGNVGIGTTSPGYKLDVAGAVNATALKINGVDVSTGGGSLSTLTAATATNTIANANFAQIWNWNTLTSQTALTLGSTSATTGTLLSLNASENSGGSSQTALKVSNAGGAGVGADITMSNNGNVAATGAKITVAAVSGIGADISLTANGSGGASKGVQITSAGVGAGSRGVAVSFTDASAAGKGIEVSHAGSGDGVYSSVTSGRAGYFNSASGYGLIVNSGSVGIGTTSPLSKLDVNGGVAIGTYAGTSAAPANSLMVSGTTSIGTTTSSYGQLSVLNSIGIAKLNNLTQMNFVRIGNPSVANDQVGQLNFKAPDSSSAATTGALIQAFVDPNATIGTGSVPMDLRFSTGGSNERMRINATGNVGIGTTSPSAKLTVVGEVRSIDSAGANQLWGQGRPGSKRYGTSGIEAGLCTSGSITFGLSYTAVTWDGAAAACPTGTWVCTDAERGTASCNTSRPDGACDGYDETGSCANWASNDHLGWLADASSATTTAGRRLGESGGAGNVSPNGSVFPVWCCN